MLSFLFRAVEVKLHGMRQGAPTMITAIDYELIVDTDGDDRRLALPHTNVLKCGTISSTVAKATKLEPRQRGCAMVFQNYALYPYLSVAENIGYSLRVPSLSKRDRTAKVKSVADALGLGKFLERKPSQLSGGQRQRVAMGRAMIREPMVFLYDEPAFQSRCPAARRHAS